MKKKIILALVFVSLFFLIVSLFFPKPERQKEQVAGQNKEGLAKNDWPVIEAKDSFYDEELLFSSIDRAKETEVRKDVLAVVSPHHFVAADFIAEIIKSASGRHISQVVIVGPNHENISNESISSAKANWETPYGIVSADNSLVGQILTDFNLTANQNAFFNEHSVGAIIPFVKYYFPQAKIVPIILSSYAGQKEAEEISDWLVSNVDKDSLIIFSMDFSHYLEKEIADKKDSVTEQLILNQEVEKIIKLNNDYVDCPAGLAMSLLYAKKKGLRTEIVRRGNSFDFAEEKPSRTTSYFTIRFWKEK